MDRLKSMEVFLKVVETGSFIAASEALNISRPMASKHVQRLEERLGVRLLNRTTRKISLTEAGRSFYLRCQNIFASIDEAVSEASNLQVEPRGRLRVNAPLSFGRDHVTKAAAAFQTIYKDITIDLTLNDRVVDIVDEGFDVAIRIGQLSDSSLIARRLANCRMLVCAAPSYLDLFGLPQHPENLTLHNCLVYAPSAFESSWTFKTKETDINVEVSGDFRANFGEAIVAAAIAGRGIILEPSFTVGPYIRSGELKPILTEFPVESLGIYAIYSQARLLPQKVRVFIDHLSKTFGPEPYWDQGL